MTVWSLLGILAACCAGNVYFGMTKSQICKYSDDPLHCIQEVQLFDRSSKSTEQI